MTTSSEGHTHCTRKNTSKIIDHFTNNREVHMNVSITKNNLFNNNIDKEHINSPSKSLYAPTINKNTIEIEIKG